MDMSAILNDDCWRAILFLCKYDFRTLSRLMCVSKQLLNLAAPLLYSRLGHPQSKRLIDTWSINKRKKLSTLLLTSSGFLDTTSAKVATPLFIDYFGLLTWLPSHLFEPDIWNELMETDKNQAKHIDIRQNNNRSTSTARHATVLTEIRIDELAQIEKWLPHAKKFAKLEVLVVNFGKTYPDGAIERILEFVDHHSAVFPGQLKEICSRNEGSEQMAMELNVLWKNPARLQLRLGDEFTRSLRTYVSKDGYNIADGEKAIDLNLATLFKSIKKLLVKDAGHVDVSTYSLFSRALQHCRQMEEIVLSTFAMYQDGQEFEGVFAWAPKELEQVTVVPATLRIDQDHQHAATRHHLATKDVGITSLVPLRIFNGRGVPESVLMDVMNGFRYSLEQIEFSSYYQEESPVSIDWTWSLPNLKILSLYDCCLAFCKLEELCPNLEELWLNNVKSLESNRHQFQNIHNSNSLHFDLDQEHSGLIKKYWRPTRSLKVLRFSLTSDSSTLELDSIANLHRLEDLSFGRLRWQEADGRNLFRQLGCVQLLHWDLSNLRRLTLKDSIEPGWSRLLLRSAPSLEHFSAPMDVMFSERDGRGFWMETRLDTLNRVAEFEARVNKWNEPGNEQLLERQKEELSREKLLDTYRTSEGDEIWNAHLAKLRLLMLHGGVWSKSGVKKLKLMFDSGHGVQREADTSDSDSSNYSSNDKNGNDSQDNNNSRDSDHNHLRIYDQVCFPHLRHVRFNGSIDSIERENMDELIKSAMQHPRMIRVEAYFSQLTTAFLESLQELDSDDFPETWEREFCSEVEDAIEYDGPCVLITLGSMIRYYCLCSNALIEP